MVLFILKNTLAPFVRLYLRKITGKENIIFKKGFIVAANHTSYYDDFVIPSIIIPLINKKIHFYVNDRFYKFLPIKLFLDHVGCIPISINKNKNSRKVNESALEKATYYLSKNEPVGIFPEGGRSKDGELKKAKTGIAYLLLKTRVPVLPIGIIGSDKVLPKGSFFLRFKKCCVNIGKPMYFSEYYGKENDKEILKKITFNIMQEVARLSGKEYNY